MTMISANKKYLNLIRVLSLAVPLVVAVLLSLPGKVSFGPWVYHLPGLNAGVNSLTALLLIMAFVAIRSGNIRVHKRLMTSCFFLGAVFLVSYVLYHSSVPSVKFGDTNHDGVVSELERALAGGSRRLYFLVLVTHILLSLAVVPMVLLSFYYALSDQISKHKKLVRWTFPVWLYVSITGVIVYFMIRPYYAF